VFVDLVPDGFIVDAAAVAAAIGERTRAIVPVHLFGELAPMADLARLAERHGLALVEDAAQAFGATPRQTLWKVELPYAFPQIMAGLNQTIMLSLSMVVIAALVGADGLGVPVIRALNSVNTSLGFESGIIIVVVAIILDRMLRVNRR
jgi:ABC-type proline/glycine betaine transport system permease subunit